jgi:3-phosphoglycerate kinase
MDSLIIGGGMAYTFLKAKGYKIGNSICEDDKLDLGEGTDGKGGKERRKPSSADLEMLSARNSVPIPKTNMFPPMIPDGWMGLDIGTITIEKFNHEIKKAKPLSGTGRWVCLNSLNLPMEPRRSPKPSRNQEPFP